jgi:alpha-beta hydrolase superfamily lysophospholipase
MIKLIKHKIKESICVLFIHGLSANRRDRIILNDELLKTGFHFYSFDLPGHGEFIDELQSSKITFEDCVNSIQNKIDQFNLNNIIVYGHSMGGAITTAIYNKNQDKVRGLILECPFSPAVMDRGFGD